MSVDSFAIIENTDIWSFPNESDDYFKNKLTSQQIAYMPQYYSNSYVMKQILNAVNEELEKFRIMIEPYAAIELPAIRDNKEGWGFEKLFAQLVVITANRSIKEWIDLADLPDVITDYVVIKNRLKLIFDHRETNNREDLRDIIEILLSETPQSIEFIDTPSIYTLEIYIRGVKDNSFEIVAEKINKARPAHLGGSINIYTCALNDSPPCELGDGSVVGPNSQFN